MRRTILRYYEYLLLSIHLKLICMINCLFQTVIVSSGLMHGSVLKFFPFLVTILVYRKDVMLKPATSLKVKTFLHWNFSSFFNCTNGTKSGNASLSICCKHLKRAFNVPNEFIIEICPRDNFPLKNFVVNFCHHIKWEHRISKSTQQENWN